MDLNLNTSRLNELLVNLQEITDLKFSLHDLMAQELYTVNQRSKFCDLICSTKDGYNRCYTCDLQAVSSMEGKTSPYQYRCHAGLVETAIPVTENGQLVVVILFGQILDNTPLDEQWRNTSNLCKWYKNQVELQKAFLQLPQLSPRSIRAAYEIVNACVSEVRLEKIITFESMSDIQRLKYFINSNYAADLTLDKISRALAISKSKLCNLARETGSDMTVGKMITRKRIEAAKSKLDQTDEPVREIASQVGISDYNYFTKVFKQFTGITPSEYRRMHEKPSGE
jgi:AraC-like DNA-binding protein